MFLAVLTAFVASGLIGYYFVGPMLPGGARPPAPRVDPARPVASPQESVQNGPSLAPGGVDVDISEDRPAAPGASYCVVVGDYPDESSARKAADDITAEGLMARVARAPSGGLQVWRVEAGSFKERAEAEKQAETLRNQGFNAAAAPEKQKE